MVNIKKNMYKKYKTQYVINDDCTFTSSGSSDNSVVKPKQSVIYTMLRILRELTLLSMIIPYVAVAYYASKSKGSIVLSLIVLFSIWVLFMIVSCIYNYFFTKNVINVIKKGM